jgi:putative transposase
VMWEQHESLFEEYLWGGGFWEESYYVLGSARL